MFTSFADFDYSIDLATIVATCTVIAGIIWTLVAGRKGRKK
jgi:hypothetical protein